MNKIIWIFWLQGREKAPNIVKKCMESWEEKNPNWSIRLLDEKNMSRYIELPDLCDIKITCTSLSNVLRVFLLKEYGGVWVDATLYCNKSLDDWLDPYMKHGFFAFNKPAPNCSLTTWFLACEENNHIVTHLCDKTLKYWSTRDAPNTDFLLQELFASLLEENVSCRASWNKATKISADLSYAIQSVGMFETDKKLIESRIDWQTPVFKLTRKYDESDYQPGSILWDLLESGSSIKMEDAGDSQEQSIIPLLRSSWRAINEWARSSIDSLSPAVNQKILDKRHSITYASLKVSTDNIGDHVQVIAGLRMLRSAGIQPTMYIDRDTEIASCDKLNNNHQKIALLLNGWFKRKGKHWPPNKKIIPMFLGFHVRLNKCPELLSDDALKCYQKFAPIGCRDLYTQQLLESYNIKCFESNCLSLTFQKRCPNSLEQTNTYVVSRDKRLLDILPVEIGDYTYINHYSGTTNFDSNMARAEELLELYRNKSKLIITTLLHCALPALAMGIPVVMFYPLNSEKGSQSDKERFSSLAKLIPIYHFDEVSKVNWNPEPVDTGVLKLSMIDHFNKLSKRWPLPVADSSASSINLNQCNLSG